MRAARASVVGVFLLAVAQVPAAEDAAPLESTKQELRQLESAQKNKAGNGAAGGVKLSTPALELRSDESRALQNWKAQQKNQESQQQQQRARDASNWLVNGVDQLGKEGAKSDATRNDPAAAEEADALGAARDPSDPQYLLKLYDDQKKRSEPKESATKVRATPAPDPFAPFLQGWLGNSPVREQVMDQFKKGSEAGGLSVATGGGATDFRPTTVTTSTNATTALREPTEQIKPNPYLAELNTPVPSRDVLAGSSATPAADQNLSPGMAPATAPLTTPRLDPLPEVRPPAKGPPLGLTDDKKYFPQQKKF
jgi:hypothetical protein